MPKSLEQILGGYATDTLTEEENRQLMEAALHDQSLFDALADEEALKALLADPKTRQRILASLEESQKSLWVASSRSSWFGWFRQSSSLAWVGSIAAMGLALIFGWQMEKDWGSIVQQEQEAERSMSEDHDNNEVEFRSQSPATVEMKEQTQDQPKKDQRESERIAGFSAPVPSPQSSTISEVSNDSERMRQPSAQFRSKDLPRQEVKKEGRLKAKVSVPQAPESVIVQNVFVEEQRVASSAASPEREEKGSQQLARPPSFADKDKLEGVDDISSPKARELFNTKKSRRVGAVEEESDGTRAQQPLGEMVSQAEKALTGEVSDVKDAQEGVLDYSQGQTKGIRYRFVRQAVDGIDEAIDVTQFSGKWSELHLAIESNVSGHLYVLTTFGKGKWQWLRPVSAKITVLSDGAIKVKDFQSVNFSLSQVTNTLGKPVVSSITVLLSSTPLTDLGKWLGSKGDMSGYQVENVDGTIFVVGITPKSVEPLIADIPL